MNTRTMKILAACVVAAVFAFTANGMEWPVARHFDGEHLLRVALPMSGIGCGSVSLSGRGELVDWEIMNRANKTMSGRRRRMPLSSPARRRSTAISS